MLIPRWVGVCSEPMLTPPSGGSFVNAPNLFVWIKEAQKHILCSLPTQYLSDHLDQASHLKFVELVPPFSCIILLKFNQNPYQISITAYLTTKNSKDSAY
jgi:hypothetical protein